MILPRHITFVSFPQLLVNRSKRKRRRRADKAVTGSEKVKLINMRTGKKVRLDWYNTHNLSPTRLDLPVWFSLAKKKYIYISK